MQLVSKVRIFSQFPNHLAEEGAEIQLDINVRSRTSEIGHVMSDLGRLKLG